MCLLFVAESGGPASRPRCGAPQLFLLVALSFCFAWPPPGWGCPPSLSLPLPFLVALALCFGCFSRPPAAWLFARMRLVCVSRSAVGCFLVVSPPPPPLLCLAVFVAPAWCLGVFFSFFSSSSSPVRPRCLPLSLVSSPGCPGPRRCALFALLAFRFSALRALVPLSCFPPGCWLLPGGCCPPPFCLAVFVAAARCCVPCAVLCCASLGAVLRRAAARCVLRCCAVLCCVALVGCRCLSRRALWRCPSPSGPVLCGAVFCGVPPRCVLCAVCVLSWRGCACCAFPVLSSLCGAVLRCAGALALCCSCGACCCWRLVVWCAVVRCWVWWPVVVCWWRVSVSVSLSGRVVCFPMVGVVCCGALLSCVVFCGAVLSRGAVLLCSAVVLRCCWGLLCPPVGCRAVLCCAVGWLCCFLPAGGVCVLWCSFPRAVRSLSSPLCALRCLAVLAVVPCFPVSCAVALCCRVVLCCRALPSFCGAVLCLLCPPAARRAAPVLSALLLVPRAVACPCALWCLPGRSAVWWCCSGVSWCLAVLCVVLWCPAPCAVSCGAVLPCGAVLVGCAVRLSALLVFVFPFVLFSFAKKPCRFSVPLKTSQNQKLKCFSLENQTLRNSRTQASSNTKVKFLTYVLPRDREDGGLAC